MTTPVKSTRSDREKALDLWNEAVVSNDSDASIQAIADALAEARREGRTAATSDG